MRPADRNGRPPSRSRSTASEYQAYEGETVMELARRVGVRIPSLCYLEGLSIHGGCRLCVVEVEGDHRLSPACALEVTAELEVTTQSWDLHEHRRRMTELLFAEGSHVCAFCVSSGNCELQDLATEHDVDHIHYDFAHPSQGVDASHPKYSLDRDRCVMCTRCVRVCDEVEGAHVWDVAMRGSQGRIVAGMDQPWGEVPTAPGAASACWSARPGRCRSRAARPRRWCTTRTWWRSWPRPARMASGSTGRLTRER
jgi:bidirectional [NiFe] hydrogenase diaphorase subunit